MTRIDLDPTEDKDGASGLLAVVITIIELLVETMEREAVRRMESGTLTNEEIERVGSHLRALDAEIGSIKEREGIETDVDRLRGQLDAIVTAAVEDLDRREIDR